MRIINQFITITLLSVLLSGCTSDDDYSNILNPKDLPHNMNIFLADYFPGMTAEKIEKLRVPDLVTKVQYIITYPEGIVVEFDENTHWLEVKSTSDFSIAETVQLLWGEKTSTFIRENFSEEKITSTKKAHYGNCITLSDTRKKLAMNYAGEFLGFDLTDKPASYSDSVIKFTENHFPDTEIKTYVVLEDPDADKIRYRAWLNNNFYFELNTNAEFVIVYGNDQLIPESIILLLPEKLQENIARNYPDAEITEIRIDKGTRYSVRVNKNTTYVYDQEKGTVVVPYQQIKDFVDEYFGKQNSISISHPIEYEILIFKVALANGFNLFTDKDGGWLTINGHGHPFPEALYQLIHYKIIEYIRSEDNNAKISIADFSEGKKYIELTNGQGYYFDLYGNFISKETKVLSAYEKANRYIRFNYPEEYDAYFYSSSASEMVFKLNDGTLLKFDKEGNFILIL